MLTILVMVHHCSALLQRSSSKSVYIMMKNLVTVIVRLGSKYKYIQSPKSSAWSQHPAFVGSIYEVNSSWHPYSTGGTNNIARF